LLILAVGYLGSEFFLKRFSIIPLLWGLVLLAWGWRMARRLVFPFAYLIFMIPLPYMIYDLIAFPLRLIAASLAGGILHTLGTPTLVEGNIIHLPYIVLNVVDACSGIRSLISLLAAGSILAYLMLPNRLSKILLVLLVFPVAVFTNALRVVTAGLLAKQIGLEAIEGSTHDFVGWAVFMVAFAIMAAITALVRRLILGWRETHVEKT
jgi:exosortase